MTRPNGDHPLIEFQDGALIDVLYWTGPGYKVQFMTHRVCNEKWEYDERLKKDVHWIKVETKYEAGEDYKVWIPRWRVQGLHKVYNSFEEIAKAQEEGTL